MAFLVSPGVQVLEKDLTNVVPGVATTNGAFAGAFPWGPVLQPLMVSSENSLVALFGKPNANNFKSFFSAANFLQYATTLWNTRLDTVGQLNATSKGTGVKVNNEDDFNSKIGTSLTATADGVWIAKYPGTFGNSIQVSIADKAAYAAWAYKGQFNGAPGDSELHIIVLDADGRWTGTAGTVLEKFDYLSKASDGKKSDGTNAYFSYVINHQSQFLWNVSPPTDQSNAALNWGVPTALTAITSTTAAGLAASATQTLSAVNAAIKVGMFVYGTNIPAGTYVYSISGTTLVMSQAATGTTAGASTLTFSQFQSLAVADTTLVSTANVGDTLIHISSDHTNVVAGQKVTGAGIPTGTKVVSVTIGVDAAVTLSNALTVQMTSGSAVSFTNGTANGTLAGGADDWTVTDAMKLSGFNLYANSQLYDVSLLIGGDASPTLAASLISLAETRKDCVAFVSPSLVADGSPILGSSATAATDTVAYRTAVGSSSSYGFMDSGFKYQYDRYNDAFRWVPLNGDIAGLVARTEFTDDAWWSPGGYTRGQIKNVVKLAFNPNQSDRDLLYTNNVNPVVTFPGNGTILYGDKTLQTKPSAFDRINVRRLFIVLEKAIATAAKYQLFEFNDPFTRAQFRNMVEPFLRDVQGRRGLTSFKVVCDETNNTSQVIDTNNFVADIYIAPSRSINFITLSFIATRTGVNFTELGA